MVTDRRFAFVERLKNGSQRLMLAELNKKVGRPLPRAARIIRQIATQPGELPTDSNTPESFRLLLPSRSNAFLAALSVQWGIDFIDLNVAIYNQATGDKIVSFNEHRFTDTNRSNCPSPVFDAVLAAEADNGVPANILATYNYSVDAENLPAPLPELVWTIEDTLLVQYSFDILTTPVNYQPGVDTFEFEVAPVAPFTLLSRNANRRPSVAPPADHFGLRLMRGTTASQITFHKPLLPFESASTLPSWFQRLLPAFWLSRRYKTAEIVAGYAR